MLWDGARHAPNTPRRLSRCAGFGRCSGSDDRGRRGLRPCRPSSPSRCRTAAAAWCRRTAIGRSLRQICDRHGVLLIADEVICAFGRFGHWFASERFGAEPDLVTFAKGGDQRLPSARWRGGPTPGGRFDLGFADGGLHARLDLRRPPGIDRGGGGQHDGHAGRGNHGPRPRSRGRVPATHGRPGRGPHLRQRGARARVFLCARIDGRPLDRSGAERRTAVGPGGRRTGPLCPRRPIADPPRRSGRHPVGGVAPRWWPTTPCSTIWPPSWGRCST